MRDPIVTEIGAVFRNSTAKIETPTARQSLTTLLHAVQIHGQGGVARATGRSVSWVSRFMADGESSAGLSEVIVMIDTLGLSLSERDVEAQHDAEYLIALLGRVERLLSRTLKSGALEAPGAEEMNALCQLAQIRRQQQREA